MYKLLCPVLLLLSFSCLQCSPAKNGIGKGTELWHGRWQWEKTHYVRRGGESLTTPKDVGLEMEIELLANGQMKVYHDKKLIKSYQYEVKLQGDLQLFVPKTDNELKPIIETGILLCTAESLEINGGYNDAGGNQMFRRIK